MSSVTSRASGGQGLRFGQIQEKLGRLPVEDTSKAPGVDGKDLAGGRRVERNGPQRLRVRDLSSGG